MDQNEGSKNSGKEKKNGEQSEANETNISKKEKKGPQQTIKRSKTAATANPARKKSRVRCLDYLRMAYVSSFV